MAVSLEAPGSTEVLIPLFPFLFGKGLVIKAPSPEIERLVNQGFRWSAEQQQKGLASHMDLLRSMESGTAFWQSLLLQRDGGAWAAESILHSQFHLVASCEDYDSDSDSQGSTSQPVLDSITWACIRASEQRAFPTPPMVGSLSSL